MVYIYILKLENDKYYVGKTDNFEKRIEEHLCGKGSKWTKKYKVIEVFHKIDNCDNYDENKYTLMMMDLNGIDNVRGGSFCEINLTDDDKRLINKLLLGNKDNCFICGGCHFANKCKNRYTIKKEKKNNNIKCFKCGKSGHYANKCKI